MQKNREAVLAFVKLALSQGLRPPEIRDLLLRIGLLHGMIDLAFDDVTAEAKPLALAKTANVTLIKRSLIELKRSLKKQGLLMAQQGQMHVHNLVWDMNLNTAELEVGHLKPRARPKPQAGVSRPRSLASPKIVRSIRAEPSRLKKAFNLAMSFVVVVVTGLFIVQWILDKQATDKKSTAVRRLSSSEPPTPSP